MFKLRKDSKGFTLVELMIVVAIIGILAAIAIPNFRNYQMKSKTAEAKTNIGAIRTSQESYQAENDTYLGNTSYPALVMGTKTTWAAASAGNFATIGFAPSGNVYYSYALNGVTGRFGIAATADLDSDAANVAAGSTYLVTGTPGNANAGAFHTDQTGNFVNRRPIKF